MNRNRKRAARLAERAIVNARRVLLSKKNPYRAEFQLARHGFRWSGVLVSHLSRSAWWS